MKNLKWSSKIELRVYRILIIIGIIAGIGYSLFYFNVPNIDPVFEETEIPAELIDKSFAWRYDIGWDFYVEIKEDSIVWTGLAGDFDGMEATVYPQYSKISDDIYFVTWEIDMVNGFDSLVINMEDNTIFGHCKANSKFVEIEGEIYYNELNNTGTKPVIE